ncbi:hypothetical protein FRC17_000292 [Serendipita sp. 399]|nr:hypothetical protein FRC17_000292 [Serendipita sp. 399]
MQSPEHPASPSPRDYRGRLVTYMDEEVEDDWIIHPKHALRINRMTEEEKRLFDDTLPKVDRQDDFFEVLEKRRRQELTDDSLKKLIEPVPPEELARHKDDKNRRTKRCKLIFRKDPAPETKQHLLEKLKTQRYFGTPGTRCSQCDTVILHDQDMKRHMEKQHGISRKRKAIKEGQFIEVPAPTYQQNKHRTLRPSAKQPTAPHPASIVVTNSPNTTVVITNNQPPPPIDRLSLNTRMIYPVPVPDIENQYASPFVHRQRGYGINPSNQSHPYYIDYRLPVNYAPGASAPWPTGLGVSGSFPLTAAPLNVLQNVELFAQSPQTEIVSTQPFGDPWMDSSVFPSEDQVPPSPPPYVYPDPSLPMQQQPFNITLFSQQAQPAPAQPLAYTNPNLGSHQRWNDQWWPKDHSRHRYAHPSRRSTEAQWEKGPQSDEVPSWCSSSDHILRWSNAFRLLVALIVVVGVLLVILTLVLEGSAIETQWVTVAYQDGSTGAQTILSPPSL